MTRQTVGKLSRDLLLKSPVSRDPIEIERALHVDYEKNVLECVERGKKEYFGEDFFTVVLTKREPLMQNVLRHYYFNRLSCPTPDYDQTLYRYTHESDQIEFLWVIPSRETSFTLLENRTQVDPSEYQLLEFVLKFADKTLWRLTKALNGEVPDSPDLVVN